MHRIAALSLVLGALLIAGASHAQSSGEAGDDGVRVYFGASGAFSHLWRLEDEFSSSTIDNEVDPGFGFGVTYGAQIPHGFSVELDFEWIEGHEIEQSSPINDVKADLVTYLLTTNLAYRPLQSRVDPFLSVGAGWMRADLDGTTGDGFAMRFGLGVDLWITDHFGTRLEGRYALPVTDEIEYLDVVGARVGLFYRF